jgi:murein L,D-transpeptidase YcbB/YkuD
MYSRLYLHTRIDMTRTQLPYNKTRKKLKLKSKTQNTVVKTKSNVLPSSSSSMPSWILFVTAKQFTEGLNSADLKGFNRKEYYTVSYTVTVRSDMWSKRCDVIVCYYK